MWLTRYAKAMYFFSVFTGSSFTAIELLTSNLFGLEVFSFDLTNRERLRFKAKRVFSIVLLEKLRVLFCVLILTVLIWPDDVNSVPQLAIQGIFLYNITELDLIAVSAVCFVLFSFFSFLFSSHCAFHPRVSWSDGVFRRLNFRNDYIYGHRETNTRCVIMPDDYIQCVVFWLKWHSFSDGESGATVSFGMCPVHYIFDGSYWSSSVLLFVDVCGPSVMVCTRALLCCCIFNL